jgi:hypothetical protein
VCEIHDVLPGIALLVVPGTGIVGADSTFRTDCCRLSNDEAESALRERAEVDKVPVVRYAIAGEARVLAHRRYPHAVPNCEIANGKRLEKMSHE